MTPQSLLVTSSLFLASLGCVSAQTSTQAQPVNDILTPKPGPAPRVNGPTVFGVTPGAPFLYTIPATGELPLSYRVDGLPEGLSVDAKTGQITGSLKQAGDYSVVLVVTNKLGSAEKRLLIKVGDTFCLTPPMGWNSWNCWAEAVDQEKVMKSAHAFVAKGLDRHGWTYINIDDTWQGKRSETNFAIQPNAKFPDIKKLASDIHGLGLKAGIYSTPWITTYAGHVGGSANNARGDWTKIEGGYAAYSVGHKLGTYGFASQDARQFADWGFDYLKYDWFPNDVEHTKEMSLALRATGRDIVYSLSNTAPIALSAELAKWANAWRTTGDIWDTWSTPGGYQNSVTENGFNQDPWTNVSSPGHYNDPDMLVLGYVGWGPSLHATRLTHAEQYSHFTLWCMLSAPLLLGCDLDRLDDFTLALITNDEVIAIDQDSLVKQAKRAVTIGAVDIYRKELEDGSVALAFFNRADTPQTITVTLDRLGFGGKVTARDLWRQTDVGALERQFPVTIEPHGVVLYKVAKVP